MIYHNVSATEIPPVLRTGKGVCGKGKEGRTAHVEGKGGDSMGTEGCCRRMERSEAFQPLTSSGTCPNLGLTCVSVACLSAMALGKRACLQETSSLCFPQPCWAGVEAEAGSSCC